MRQVHDAQRSFKYPGPDVEPALLTQGEPNLVSTTRFTALTWLPKSLWYQFQRAANLYFLFIAVIVCLPFSPKRWQSKVFPYIAVLAWTSLKDLYEDSRRRADDRRENARQCWRYDFEANRFERIAWRHVKPGDFVCTLCDEPFPADLLLLCAEGGQGAFISTVNLDGETNLKLRTAPKAFSSFRSLSTGRCEVPPPECAEAVAELCRRQLELRLAVPSADLSDMHASITLDGGSAACAASCDNFAPRGCVLRNTPWMLSLVAYAGRDTKACLNSAQAKGKVSLMQRALNRCVYGLLTALFLACCYMATAAKVVDPGTDWLVRFLTYTITVYHVVPISLYVSFELLKLVLGRFIDMDAQMVDPISGQGATTRTADLVEEMGQIDFVFSDKTGTLTANEMRFARCALGRQSFGSFIQDPSGGPVPGLLAAKEALKSDASERREEVLWFFTCLAVCHTVQVSEDMQFSGPSPDEVALVEGARSVGVTFSKRRTGADDQEEIVLSGPDGDRVFVLRHVIEFNAERKRMSVLCEHNGAVYCLTKGADSIMSPLLTTPLGAWEEDQLRSFSQLGLRTLVVASKKVAPADFARWEAAWSEAQNSMQNHKERVAQVGADMEKELQLAGLTAVEDRLQDGVPEAIATLKAAGIRLWVLTGDKTETAVDIAYSCNLFSKDMDLAFVCNCRTGEDIQMKLQEAKQVMENGKPSGLVLDGQTLKLIFQQGLAVELYELAMLSRCCVCSRLSPAQKRQIVEEVRKNSGAITLAIGDGANDVPMISGAHLGIGIRGKEGSQAVQASDIAISQFRFLVPLLLCHGSRAYRRIATFLCYYLYKNAALAWGDLIWAHQNGFSGEVAYPEWLSTSFNALFTSWPVIIVLAFDQDVDDAVANTSPGIYLEGLQRQWFNAFIFSSWMVAAWFHGCLAWLLPSAAFGFPTDYESPDFWRASTTSFTLVIFIVTLKLVLHSLQRCSAATLGPLALSLAVYLLVLFLLGYTSIGSRMQPNLAGDPPVPGWIFSNMEPLLMMVLGTLCALLPDWAALLWVRRLRPSPLFQVRSASKSKDKEMLT
ncbi:unnamed protein product [Effrenium voratum]|nr:unnamed protein product [Effrenium voratum]|mmetsp:Transcript_76774/g.183922  ORF Transcript_76774/g.183922 Transcript_76774/m.183922 type:complete len:1061 (+) Transcript_76774:49-3231(+)